MEERYIVICADYLTKLACWGPFESRQAAKTAMQDPEEPLYQHVNDPEWECRERHIILKLEEKSASSSKITYAVKRIPEWRAWVAKIIENGQYSMEREYHMNQKQFRAMLAQKYPNATEIPWEQAP